MAVTTTPVVTLFAYGVSIDLSDVVLGVSVTTTSPVGACGETTGTVDLNNTDGRFTPGGGGTYSTTDWFGHAIMIDATTNDGTTTRFADVADLIVTGFDLYDDGVTSFVRLTLDDPLTVAGGNLSTITTSSPYNFTPSPVNLIDDVFDGGTATNWSISGVDMPTLGHDQAGVAMLQVMKYVYGFFPSADADFDIEQEFDRTAPAKDLLNTTILPAGPWTMWPTTIRSTTSGPYTRAVVDAYLLGPYTVRLDIVRTDYTFADTPGTGELPFAAVQRTYTTDELVNTAQITTVASPSGSYTVTGTNTDSVAKYGSRARYFQELFSSDPAVTFPTATEADTLIYPQAIADRWANMFSDVVFHIADLQLSGLMVSELAPNSAAEWTKLLDITDGLWNYVTVNYTPTGSATELTADGVIYTRTVDMTPTDTTVRLGLYPRGVLAAFILDDAAMGVLDQDRLA